MATRGAIERVEEGYVSGWVSRSDGSMRGAVMLAFLGSECLGAGRVEIHRPDIADAGLGDGHAGFVVHTRPIAKHLRNRVHVKIEGDDAILVRPDFHHAEAGSPPEAGTLRLDERLRSVRWMRDRGWLSQGEADILRTLLRFGAYEVRITDAADGPSLIDQCRASLAKTLALVHHRDLEVETAFCPDASALAVTLDAHRGRPEISYVGLWSTERNRVNVAEGSHVASSDGTAVQHAIGVAYEFGGTQMLVVDPRVALSADEVATQTLVFSAA